MIRYIAKAVVGLSHPRIAKAATTSLLALAFGAASPAHAVTHAPFAVAHSHSLNTAHRADLVRNVDRESLFKQVLPLYQYDKKQPLSVAVTKTKRYPECVMLRIVYSSANGERVPAVVFEPFRASRWHPVPAVILLHGLGGSKEDLVPFGHFLAATGYASLIIDEYGHGERKNEGQGRGETDALHGFEQTIIDVRRGIDYLQLRPHINPHRIGVLGFSLGALIGADAMGIDYRIRAGVFISGGGNVGSILKHLSQNSPSARERMSGFNWNVASMFLTAVDPLTFASHIAPRPVLMQNGMDDNIVVPTCAKALYHAISSGKGSRVQIDWCKDCGHLLPLGKIYPHMRVWLDKNLKGEMSDADTEISAGP
jgi:cephalosporin-C deacetylase-like acetyl esterase